VEVTVAVEVGVGVAVDVGVAVWVGVEVSVGPGVAVAVGVGVSVAVAVDVGVAVASGGVVAVAVGVSVAVAVAVGTVPVGVNVWVEVAVAVDVDVGVGTVPVGVTVGVDVAVGVAVAIAGGATGMRTFGVGVAGGTPVGVAVGAFGFSLSKLGRLGCSATSRLPSDRPGLMVPSRSSHGSTKPSALNSGGAAGSGWNSRTSMQIRSSWSIPFSAILALIQVTSMTIRSSTPLMSRVRTARASPMAQRWPLRRPQSTMPCIAKSCVCSAWELMGPGSTAKTSRPTMTSGSSSQREARLRI
jgi:hypothetical protein